MREPAWTATTLGGLTQDGRPICYGVLKPGPHIPDGVPLVRITNMDGDFVSEDNLYRISRWLDKEFERSRLAGGELLLSIQGTIGRVAIASRRLAGANISRTIARVALVPDADVRFVRQWFLSEKGQERLKSAVVGTTRASLNIGDLRMLNVPQPPLPEQRQVAEILDTIDEAIRKTEEIIAKLKQVKQGLLHDLLTRGIDDNGELRDPDSHPEQFKDSPLGRIPKGWETCDLGSRAALVTSGSRGWARFYSGDGALFVRSQNVRMGYLDFADRQCVTPPRGSEGQRTRLEPRDMLVTITGNSVGNVSLVPSTWCEDAFVSQHVGLVRLVEPELTPFAVLFLISGSPGNQQILDAQYGQSKPGLNLDNLKGLQVPVVPAAEREAIVERVFCLQRRLDAEEATSRGIVSLKTGLMEDLLTGRVRVTPLLEHAAE